MKSSYSNWNQALYIYIYQYNNTLIFLIAENFMKKWLKWNYVNILWNINNEYQNFKNKTIQVQIKFICIIYTQIFDWNTWNSTLYNKYQLFLKLCWHYFPMNLVINSKRGKFSTLPKRFEILLYYQWSKSANSSTILIFPPPRELENSFAEENVWIQRCYQCKVIEISHKMRLKLNINLQCYSDLHAVYTTHQFGIRIKGI